MNYSTFGQHPLAYEVRYKYGRERKLPCLNGLDNSAPFDGDPLARLDAIISADYPPPQHDDHVKADDAHFRTPSDIVEGILGMPMEKHAAMVMKGKASRELYKED